MVILMNPYSGGGTAERKWNGIAGKIAEMRPRCEVYRCGSQYSAWKTLSSCLAAGETEYIAAGGDGTVNAVLNSLMNCSSSDQINAIRMGAIGLGSSNDFHKPFSADHMIDGIPYSIDTCSAQQRDVGRLTFEQNGKPSAKYFLINASVGVTAEANSFFNHPDKVLARLKRHSPPVAILYAAMGTVLSYRNNKLSMLSREFGSFVENVTNLGIVKNPHFSGNFHFPGKAEYNSGKFSIHLFHDMTRVELLRMMRTLSNGYAGKIEKSRSWKESSLTLSGDTPFAVEFDGEVIRTRSVQFEIVPQALWVCQ
ncbi:MAG TPA: diacylglycerol kinase family protein [Bacteroidota bacterium]|nr:diacylglycerol kinase family protein [Bacteroidota bacterium]